VNPSVNTSDPLQVCQGIPARAAAVLARMPKVPAGWPGRFVRMPHGAFMHSVDRGAGHPVVMVHGNPSWSYLFRGLVEPLAKTRRVIIPDHIGCGMSDLAPLGYCFTLKERVADFGNLVHQLAPTGPVDLIVHDWGGMIGLAWAVQNPTRVGRIVVMNSAGFGLPPGASIPMSLRMARTPGLGSLLIRGFNAFVRGAIRYGTVKPLSVEVKASFLAPYHTSDEREATLRFVEDIPLTQSHPSWNLVQNTSENLGNLAEKPLMILWGMQDFVFTKPFLDTWRTRRPDARCVEYPQAGHWLLEDVLEPCLAEIRNFLEPVHGSAT